VPGDQLRSGGFWGRRIGCWTGRPRSRGPVANYQAFAKAWTRRNEDYGDPTLEIIIDAVVDEMHLSAIPRKRGYGEARIERALIGGLRDYAARAGFVTGHKAIQWQAEAAAVFGPWLEPRIKN
jgi:hypothetical protein